MDGSRSREHDVPAAEARRQPTDRRNIMPRPRESLLALTATTTRTCTCTCVEQFSSYPDGRLTLQHAICCHYRNASPSTRVSHPDSAACSCATRTCAWHSFVFTFSLPCSPGCPTPERACSACLSSTAAPQGTGVACRSRRGCRRGRRGRPCCRLAGPSPRQSCTW